ncbi:hypothetical protein CHCC20375_2477 [Bacillus licheniformis]|nr:hypothetical protein CHCC20375_2477 [Bacillus licheniformis]
MPIWKNLILFSERKKPNLIVEIIHKKSSGHYEKCVKENNRFKFRKYKKDVLGMRASFT